MPELQHGVLFAAAGVLGGAVDDGAVAAEEPAGAGVEGEGGEEGGAFEDVEEVGEGGGWEAGGGGFVVF